jgi:peptidylprolyl isomerase
VRALKHGPDAMDGAVRDNPDVMTRVRVAADLPEAERPRVEVLDVRAPAFEALVERTRTERGVRFSICDIELPARVS